MSIWHLMTWALTGHCQKSAHEVTQLVHNVLQAPDFSIAELTGFDAHTETCCLDAAQKTIHMDAPFSQDKWQHRSINIVIPTREKNQAGNGKTFTVEGFYHQPFLNVICAVFSEASSKWFHLTPFKKVGMLDVVQKNAFHPCLKVWKSLLTGKEQLVYDELYMSDTWNKAQDEIMKQRRVDGCKLERVMAAMMLWSDSMCLAEFGRASAWPVYLYFGHLSKYARTAPEGGACHPIAFIPCVSVKQAITRPLQTHRSFSFLSQYMDS